MPFGSDWQIQKSRWRPVGWWSSRDVCMHVQESVYLSTPQGSGSQVGRLLGFQCRLLRPAKYYSLVGLQSGKGHLVSDGSLSGSLVHLPHTQSMQLWNSFKLHTHNPPLSLTPLSLTPLSLTPLSLSYSSLSLLLLSLLSLSLSVPPSLLCTYIPIHCTLTYIQFQSVCQCAISIGRGGGVVVVVRRFQQLNSWVLLHNLA